MTLRLIIGLLVLSSVGWAQTGVPYGWKIPTKSELSQAQDKDLVAAADFDGDGKPDKAIILVDKAGRAAGLFVFASSTSRWMKLESGPVSEWQDLHLAVVKPGKYETACGKGYGEYACAHGEPENLVLKLSAIDLFKPESADVYFYWDSKTKSFRKAQITD